MESKKTYQTIDDYIENQAENVKPILKKLQKIIHESAPEATETISYGMPAFRQQSVLVYFAAHKNHIGFYPTASPIVYFAEELKNFKTSKGTIQIPVNTELPGELIEKIVKYRLQEIIAKK
ncbi:MAG: DUF1801 domain-containing protein [Paludibacter sp.]|nr:DUF1801 domain-containing protein [Paludibacter sp.]